MISHANIFLIASVIDESLSPAATGSSPGGDSGESWENNINDKLPHYFTGSVCGSS